MRNSGNLFIDCSDFGMDIINTGKITGTLAFITSRKLENHGECKFDFLIAPTMNQFSPAASFSSSFYAKYLLVNESQVANLNPSHFGTLLTINDSSLNNLSLQNDDIIAKYIKNSDDQSELIEYLKTLGVKEVSKSEVALNYSIVATTILNSIISVTCGAMISCAISNPVTVSILGTLACCGTAALFTKMYSENPSHLDFFKCCVASTAHSVPTVLLAGMCTSALGMGALLIPSAILGYCLNQYVNKIGIE